jgi:spore germination protein KB
LLAVAFAIPAMFVYSRLLSLYPGKDLYDILEIIFGNFFCKFIQLLYWWYAFFLGSIVIRDFSEFIRIVAMHSTPTIISKILMAIVCILVIRDGIEVLGRVLTFVLPILITIILFTVILSLPNAQLSNLEPTLYDGFKPVVHAAFATFSFPLGETVVFTMVYSSLKNSRSSYKVYYCGLLIGSLLIMLVTLRNVMVLGPEFAGMLYFPSYSSVSVIKFGEFLQRIEASVSVVFLFAGFAKISVCMYVATKGFAKIFQLGDYRTMVAPIGLSMALLSGFIFKNASESVEWAKNILPYYSLPFLVILPLFILAAAEIKIRLQK